MFQAKRFCHLILINIIFLTGLLQSHPANATVDVTTGFVSERITTFISLYHEDASPMPVLVAELAQNVNALDNVFHRLLNDDRLLPSHPVLAIEISDDAYQGILSGPRADGYAVLSLENDYHLDLDPQDIFSADKTAIGPAYRIELALWPVSYNELLTLVLLLPRLNAENSSMELLPTDIRQYRDKFAEEIAQQSIFMMGSYTDLLWSPDGNLLLSANWSDRRLNYQVFNFAANEVMSLDRLEHYILPPTFSPDSRFIVYSSQTELRIVDVKRRRTTGFSLREWLPDDYQLISNVAFAVNKTGDTIFFSPRGWSMPLPSPTFLWRSANPEQLEKVSGLEVMEKPDLPGETWSAFLHRPHGSRAFAEPAELKEEKAYSTRVDLAAIREKLQARYGAVYGETINHPRNDYLAVLTEGGNRLRARVFSLPSLEERSIYAFAFLPEPKTEIPGTIAGMSLFNAAVIAVIILTAAGMTMLILFVRQNICPAAGPVSLKKKLLLFAGALIITLLLHFAAGMLTLSLVDDDLAEAAEPIAREAVAHKYADLGYTVKLDVSKAGMFGSSPLWFIDLPYQFSYWGLSGFNRFVAPVDVWIGYSVFDQHGDFIKSEEARFYVFGADRMISSHPPLP
jgi:hypothetical protein